MTTASDPLFEALREGLEVEPENITEPYRRRLEKVLAQLHEPDEDVLRHVAATYRELGFTRVALTPERVTEHWPDLIRQRRLSLYGAPTITGYRFVRGTHSGTYVRDPKGTDRPPPGYSIPDTAPKPASP